jgi:DNA-3-methyladenine glycosylase II
VHGSWQANVVPGNLHEGAPVTIPARTVTQRQSRPSAGARPPRRVTSAGRRATSVRVNERGVKPAGAPALPLRRRASVRVAPPFRLDLTVAILRRLATNPVERWDAGRYLRVFDTPAGPAGWLVRQAAPGALAVALHGAELPGWRDALCRALGLAADVAGFHRRAARLPDLAPLARPLAGARPPRFASLHEAFALVIPFQQVSLAAGMAIMRRLVEALAAPVALAGLEPRPFPSAEALARAPDRVLRGAGLSAAKARALAGACAAVAEGRLGEAELAALPTPALLDRLREVPGIGPWSAALVALRGFGRLDLFPAGDAAAGKALGSLGRGPALLEALGPWRGMLYYALLARRLLEADAMG